MFGHMSSSIASSGFGAGQTIIIPNKRELTDFERKSLELFPSVNSNKCNCKCDNDCTCDCDKH